MFFEDDDDNDDDNVALDVADDKNCSNSGSSNFDGCKAAVKASGLIFFN